MSTDSDIDDKSRQRLSSSFNRMLKALYSQTGASLKIGIIKDPEVTQFVDTHADILNSSMQQTKMSDDMRQRLEQSNWVFSGMKTFHELNEAFPSLLDEKGDKKPFERFLNDVQKIDDTYNKNYLRAEYNFIGASAQMAGKWEDFAADGDRYNLQYRTAGDDKVRPEHAAMNGVTLPMDDSFWKTYYPPNGWNCRCTVVQVRKSKQPATPHDDAMAAGLKATTRDKKGMFRFNPGLEKRSVPSYNPYTVTGCKTCTKKKTLAFIPSNEVCAACEIVNECYANKLKSQKAIEQKHYLREMSPLLTKRIELKAEGDKTLNIGFTKAGNKHLYSDAISRSRILHKEDLATLDKTLSTSTYMGTAALTHKRADRISKFYYFEAKIRGEKIKLNVAEMNAGNKAKTRLIRFLYSINDIK